RAPFGSLGEFFGADETTWAYVPAAQESVLAYIREHAPAGTTVTNVFYPPTPLPTRAQVELGSSRPATGPISETITRVALLALAGGTTDVRIDGIVLWVPAPVPIPPGAQLLKVSAHLRGAGSDSEQRSVTTAHKTIEAARAIVDGLPVARLSLRPLK